MGSASTAPTESERTRPWPENAWPTPEQWLPWFLNQAPDEQAAIAEMLLLSAQENHRARLVNAPDHASEQRIVEAVRQTLADMAEDWPDATLTQAEAREFITETPVALALAADENGLK